MQSSPVHILVLDDKPEVRKLTKQFLELSAGLKVDLVSSASEARTALLEGHYHAIVSGYRMPDEDGIQFLRSLRSTGDRTPFILFNDKGPEEVVIEALNSGADAYVQKGGEPGAFFAELEHRIATIVQRGCSETALMDSESEFRSLFENNPDLVALADFEGRILKCNQACALMVSLPIEQVIGHTISSLGVFKEDDLVRFQKAMEAISRGEPCPPIEAQVHREDGTKGWVEVRASIIRKAGHAQVFQIIGRDITEQKHAEEELRQTNAELRRTNDQVEAAEEVLRKQYNSIMESEDDLRKEMAFSQSVMDSLPGIFYLYDAQTLRLVKWNKNHQEVSGYTQEEMLGKHVLEWHRPENADAVLASNSRTS